MLSLDTPREAPKPSNYQQVIDRIAQWRAEEVQNAFLADRVQGQEPQRELTDFQRGLEKAAKANAARERARARRKGKQGSAKKTPKARDSTNTRRRGT